MTFNKIQGQTQTGSLTRGAYIYSWVALCRGIKGRRHSTSSLCRKARKVVNKKILETGEVVSTQTEVPLTCSLLNYDHLRGGVEK